MRHLPKRLLALSIWAPGTFGSPPERYANIYRIVLPLFNASLVYAGAWATQFGAPAIDTYTGGVTAGAVWGVAIGASATLALIGISIPRLFYLEVLGKIGMFAALTVYLAALVILTASGSEGRGIVSGVSVAAWLLTVWRLGDMRTERAHRAQLSQRRKEIERLKL